MIRDERGRKWPVWKTQGRPLLWFWQMKEPTVRRSSEHRKQGESMVGFLSRNPNRKLLRSCLLCLSLSLLYLVRAGVLCALVQRFHPLDQVLRESQKQVLPELSLKLEEKPLHDPVFIT